MTRAELEMCQQELEIRQPFICESGAAVLLPNGYFPFDVPADRELAGYHVIEFGRPYVEVVDLLRRTASRTNVPMVAFSDLSVEQVAAECGLSLSQARLAKLREYDEPIRILDAAARQRLFKALHSAGLACTYHGAYDHVGVAVDKGRSVGLLTTLYRRARGPLVTVGVGDETNSVRLLSRVKLPFVVETQPNHLNARLLQHIPRVRLAPDSPRLMEAMAEIVEQARDQRVWRRVAAAG